MNKCFFIILAVFCSQPSWSQLQQENDSWTLLDKGSYSVLYDSTDVMHTIVYDSLNYFEVFIRKSYSSEAYISWGETQFTNDSILFLPKRAYNSEQDSNFLRLDMLTTFRDRRPYVMVRPTVRGIHRYMFCCIKPEEPEVVRFDFAKLNRSLDSQLLIVRSGIYTLKSKEFSHSSEDLFSGGIITEVLPTEDQLFVSIFCGLFSFHFQIKPDEKIQTNMYLSKEQLDSLINSSVTTVYVEAHTF